MKICGDLQNKNIVKFPFLRNLCIRLPFPAQGWTGTHRPFPIRGGREALKQMDLGYKVKLILRAEFKRYTNYQPLCIVFYLVDACFLPPGWFGQGQQGWGCPCSGTCSISSRSCAAAHTCGWEASAVLGGGRQNRPEPSGTSRFYLCGVLCSCSSVVGAWEREGVSR